LVAIAGQKPNNGRGQQTEKLGAAFVHCHAVWMQGIGARAAIFCRVFHEMPLRVRPQEDGVKAY
jgi:hypothetical protein